MGLGGSYFCLEFRLTMFSCCFCVFRGGAGCQMCLPGRFLGDCRRGQGFCLSCVFLSVRGFRRLVDLVWGG